MNDAFRGVLVAGAVLAFYMAARLTVVFVRQWSRAGRRFVAYHAMFMTLALAITAGLLIARLVDVAGSNAGLVWWDAARTVQIAAMVAGLRPLWSHQRRRETT